MNTKQARWYQTLFRRKVFLMQKINQRARLRLRNDYESAEDSAINFALECIELCNKNNLLTKETGTFRIL